MPHELTYFINTRCKWTSSSIQYKKNELIIFFMKIIGIMLFLIILKYFEKQNN